jgi:aminopeptidase N
MKRSKAEYLSLLRLPIVTLALAGTVSAQDRGFSDVNSRTFFTPERTYDVIHMKLEPSIDILDRRIDGIATTTLTPINDGLTVVTFDAVDLEVSDVTNGSGLALEYRTIGAKLEIDLERAYQSAETLSVVITYTAHPHEKGLYFVRPDEGYPNKRLQVWSQGEMEESRYWFPCWDFPNDKLTSEMIVTVDNGFKAISNGALIDSIRNQDGTTTFHWREDIPHVYYLVSLVIGEFAVIRDSWNNIPVNYYVVPEDSSLAERSFSKTPDMMEFFSTKIGIPYPYEKYAQVVVQDFIWGGMENISASTMTRRMLHDERAHQDYTSHGLVAHELAHQWWGNLITTKNWSNAWLNEGFTSYFDLLYTEHDLGLDEFAMRLRATKNSYFGEDRSRYRRNVVTNLFEDPEQMFDSHTYRKGALVMHMLRTTLGDKLFWKAINYYATTNREKSVETSDFRRAIEESTGKPLEKFFAQWIHSAGYPELKVSWRWNASRNTVNLDVSQTQDVDSLTPLFDFDVNVMMTGDFGSRSFDVRVSKENQTFVFSAPARPSRVEFDPAGDMLMKLEFEKTSQEWLEQLAKAGTVTGRIRAAIGLKKFNHNSKVTTALIRSLTDDPFWGVRAEAARSLGKIRSKEARDGLIKALNESDSRARVVIVAALGEFDDDGAGASALRRVFGSDDSYKVRAEALKSLAKTGANKTFRDCRTALKQDSYRQWIRSAAFTALVELKDKRGIDLALKWSEYGRPEDVRTSAIAALPKLAETNNKRNDEIREVLISFLDDRSYRARGSAIAALGELGDPEAISALQRSAETEAHFRRRKQARAAIDKIRNKTSKEAQIADLRKDIDRVKKKNRDLQEQVDALSNQLNPASQSDDK